MVQQISRSSLEALRIGQASDELARIASTPYDVEIGFDIETTGLKPREDRLIMLQFKPRGRKVLLIDARDEDRGALYSALLPLITDARRTFVGQNLLFELSWLLSHVGFEVDDLRARFSDIQVRELVILGLGYGDAYKRGLAVSMRALGETYGVAVHKEERSWFIDLDTRVEAPQVVYDADDREWEAEHADDFEEFRPWDEPFPQEILEYARQDVSVVHLISAAQQKLIDEYGLQEVVDLESRCLPATAGMMHYGLAVDRDKWLETMAGIDKKAEELATRLHIEIDVPIMEYRRRAWLEKAQPYQQWAKDKAEFEHACKVQWEYEANMFPGDKEYTNAYKKGKGTRTWGYYKRSQLEQWMKENPKPANPPALKDGVNLNSPAQILIAFQSRGHQIDSAKEEVLTPLAAADPVAQLYLDYKDYATARVKYGPKFLEEHAPDGTLYARIQQVGTETGRFAFKEPNIQQVPARGAGAGLRKAIVPRHGYVFIDYDFTNVELMITAWIARDPVMLKAFADREDLHARTAEVMFGLRSNPAYLAALADGVTPKQWTDGHDAVVAGKTLAGTSYRSIAKTINFGLLYGMGQYRLASKLRIDVEAAKQLMRLYRETYKVAVAWLARQGARIENPDENGKVYAATLAGRRRWFQVPKPVISKNATGDEAQEALQQHKKHIAAIQRQLANHPIQGTSADTTKLAIALWQENYNSPEMRLVCTIHDELLLEVEDSPVVVHAAKERLGECMHHALTHFLTDMDIPIPSGKVSDHWEH